MNVLAIWRTTLYAEILNPASPTESHAVDQGRATRVIRIHWQYREDAVRDFLGYAEVVNANGSNYLSRTTPHPYPGYPRLFCTSVPRIVGINPIGSTNLNSEGEMLAAYEYGEMTLVYSALPYEVREDYQLVETADVDGSNNPSEGEALKNERPRYISKIEHPGIKTLTFNRQLMKRVDTNLPVQEGVPLQVPYVDIDYTWHNVPAEALPRTTWGKTMGKINDAAFDGYPAQTLFMEPPKTVIHTDPFGNRTYDVLFRCRFMPQYGIADPNTAKGWNYYLVPQGNGAAATLEMVKLTVNGQDTGDASYRTADFTQCFEVP